MHTKILIEGLSFFQSSKIPPGDIDGAAAVGHYFFVNSTKVSSYEVATITF